MANRNDSDSRQHETLPGPGPGTNGSIGGKSVGGSGRPVEQVMDAAIERIAREREHPIELARRSAAAGEAHLARREGTQLPVRREPTRLRWKGLDVSEEFRQYAERVARGEQLPPFEGRVLAEPNPAFPWGEAAVADEPAKKRGSHPVIWGAAIVFLGLLGWSLVLQVQGNAARDSGQNFSEQSAALETSVAPLAPAPVVAEPAASATPHDVVETPSLGTQSPTLTSPSGPSPSEPTGPTPGGAAADPSVIPAAHALAAAPLPTLASPAVASSTPVADPSRALTGASVAVDLARPGALQQAVGAALAARNGASPPAQSNPAPSSPPPRDDEFGIMASVSPAPVAAAPAAPAPSTAPAGAKSNGNVGDLSRASQPSAPGVRKEPGSESSAKGSLLVETPSF